MRTNWRTPAMVLLCSCLILTLSLGTRQSFGLFLRPMSGTLGWGRETFAFAIAIQNLIWGLGQPFAGMVADKFGAARVVVLAGLFYVVGLICMSLSTTSGGLLLSAGLLIGLGLSGTGFGVILGVIGRTVAPEKRSMALGIAAAGGSFGQFIMLPFGQTLITHYGWQTALVILALAAGFIVPLASAMVSGKPKVASGVSQSITQALREAGSHKGFWLLTAGFLVCGFQTAFIMLHLPAYLIDKAMTPVTGMTALALIGFFNIIGSFLAGLLGGRYSKKYLLTTIYFMRSVVIVGFLMLPVTPITTYVFAAAMGLLWLGTVPLTNGLVAQIFGVKYLSTLFGIVFLGHQIGSFLGAWLGGYLFDATGSYQIVWGLMIGLSLLAGLLNLPIDERQMARLATNPGQA